jgi:hypothetical protein
MNHITDKYGCKLELSDNVWRVLRNKQTKNSPLTEKKCILFKVTHPCCAVDQHVCVCVCVYIFICIYIYAHARVLAHIHVHNMSPADF